MLLDPGMLDLCPRAVEVVARAGDPRFELELPAAQIEIVLPPTATVGESAAALGAARRDLATAGVGIGLLAAAGPHPFADPVGALNDGPRHAPIADAYAYLRPISKLVALHRPRR